MFLSKRIFLLKTPLSEGLSRAVWVFFKGKTSSELIFLWKSGGFSKAKVAVSAREDCAQGTTAAQLETQGEFREIARRLRPKNGKMSRKDRPTPPFVKYRGLARF